MAELKTLSKEDVEVHIECPVIGDYLANEIITFGEEMGAPGDGNMDTVLDHVTAMMARSVRRLWGCDRITRVMSVELLDDGWCVLIREDAGISMNHVRWRINHDDQAVIGYHGHATQVDALAHAIRAYFLAASDETIGDLIAEVSSMMTAWKAAISGEEE